MQIPVRGFTFDVIVAGPADGSPVLLLHGFPQNAMMWDHVSTALHAAGSRTIAPNQRGYSPGARPSGVDAYVMGELVADAIAILDALGVDRADVVGHDWGSIVAWHLAAEHPDRVRSLTAISVPHPIAFGQAIEHDEDQQRRSAYIRLFRQEGKAEDVLLEDDAVRLVEVFDGLPPDRIEAFVGPLRSREALTGTLNWYRAMSRGAMACDRVRVPTTFVWGDADLAVGATAARACADFVDGDYRFVPMIGVGHWIADEVPGALVEEILDRSGT
jgi:pimeloyl-ACP methyl ester carboxylesterase